MIALFAGSFHPPTNGHLDVIKRSAKMFEKVYVAVMANPDKKYILSAQERVRMLKKITEDLDNVEVVTDSGLTAELAGKLNAQVLVRGVRGVGDMEYEINVSNANRMLTGVDTVFLPCLPEHSWISSSIVNDIARHGGAIGEMVPEAILEDIKRAIAHESKGV
ncbi:MAG: pantetheine-phosphate adenylyltransferase [Clostridia bacterium]|nr:pantetheine-phosphate adenylyltransferase [Clostridia bacterium]MBQ4157680.1 pantetheine-phosphate adenylyltransferase [Clostridia bacterium]